MQHLKLLDLKDLKQQSGKTGESMRWTVTQGTKERRWNLARFGRKWWALTLVVNLGALISQLETEEMLGVPLPTIQKLMRHRRIETTMIYIETREQEMRNAINLVG